MELRIIPILNSDLCRKLERNGSYTDRKISIRGVDEEGRCDAQLPFR